MIKCLSFNQAFSQFQSFLITKRRNHKILIIFIKPIFLFYSINMIKFYTSISQITFHKFLFQFFNIFRSFNNRRLLKFKFRKSILECDTHISWPDKLLVVSYVRWLITYCRCQVDQVLHSSVRICGSSWYRRQDCKLYCIRFMSWRWSCRGGRNRMRTCRIWMSVWSYA